MLVRLQKFIADLGIASRRQAEKIITQGRITVNGKIAELGVKVSPADKIYLDTRQLKFATEIDVTRILLYNKPIGVICSRSDPEGRPTVFDNLPKLITGRWISVGRLDINSSGLLLFTNDGQLATRLMHPSAELEREYMVRVIGDITFTKINNLKKGIELEDGIAKFNRLQKIPSKGVNQWFKVVLLRGKNREVRRLWQSQDCEVSRLQRIRYGNVALPRDLAKGDYREIKGSTII